MLFLVLYTHIYDTILETEEENNNITTSGRRLFYPK